MDHDPNAHDPTLGDDDFEDDDDLDPDAIYGDPDDDAPVSDKPVARDMGSRNYRDYVDQAKRAGSIDELFAQAAQRVKTPPKPRSDEEKAEMEDAVADATSKALKAGGAGCPACGSPEVEEEAGMLRCRACGAHSPVGPRVWQVITQDGEPHACCSKLCAQVASRRETAAMSPAEQPWTGGDLGECFGCGGEITVPETPTPAAASGPAVMPLGGGLTAVSGVPTTGQLPSSDFRIGERVRLKDPPQGVDPASWTGTVAVIPDPNKQTIRLGSQLLGNEVGVDTDSGNRAVADADKWERVPDGV